MKVKKYLSSTKPTGLIDSTKSICIIGTAVLLDFMAGDCKPWLSLLSDNCHKYIPLNHQYKENQGDKRMF